MGSKEEAVSGRGRIDVTLAGSTQELDEVVVTAMGITRSQKALGYAVQTLKADELVQASNPNIGTALAGKTTGISVRQSSGMPGASMQINIRGARSFEGDNTPLYVVDGMPIASTYGLATGNSVSGTDYSNRAIDIDPNDIESINILEGQASAALYGIRASNGVIVITTKSGKKLAKGKPQVTFSSSASVDIIARYPQMQTTYAQGTNGAYSPTSSMSWGPKIEDLPNSTGYGGNTQNAYTRNPDGTYDLTTHAGKYYVPQRAQAGLDPWVTPASYNNVKDYFDKGLTWTNFVNVAQALDRSSYSLSLGSTNQTGIVRSTGMDRYNVKLSAETNLIEKYLTGGFTSNYVNTSMSKMPSANDGLVATIYGAPPSYDLKGIPSHYDGDPYRQTLYRGSWNNPYWMQDNEHFGEKTDRFFGNFYLDFATQLTENQKLAAKYQLGIDVNSTLYSEVFGYGDQRRQGGEVQQIAIADRTINSLLTLSYDWKINQDLALNAIVGSELDHNNNQRLDTYGALLDLPGWNHLNNGTSKDNSERLIRKRSVGFFGSLSLSWKDMVYLSATGRNDIVSNMPPNSRSFFYPSVSLGFIFTELEALKNNRILNYGKLRASFAEVGQAGSYRDGYYYTPSYGGGFYFGTPILYPINGQSAYVPYYTVYDPNLKPQNTQSYELGVDLGLLQNLITIKYTYSRQNVKDQIFSVPLAGSTGSSQMFTNAGKLHTDAHEITLGFNPVRTTNVNWDFAFNWSKIDNMVDELAPGVESIMLGGFVSPQVRASAGDSYPVIFGESFKRDEQGRILVDERGIPMVGDAKVIGKASPDWTLGFTTTLRVFKFTLSAVLDLKWGGQMYQADNGLINFYGTGKDTENREGTIVFDGYKADGTKNDIAITGAAAQQTYYSELNNITESMIYGNSFLKLREVALSYPVVQRKGFSLSLNVFARNLLLWTELPNFDPESSQGNGNMVGAFERFSLPQTSSYGGGLSIKF
jgi:TonB-linked SusC/RagA family outer membrane protein